LVFDIIYAFTGRPSTRTVAFWNAGAGVVGALLAAIPGFVDWLTLTGRAGTHRDLSHDPESRRRGDLRDQLVHPHARRRRFAVAADPVDRRDHRRRHLGPARW